MIELIMIHPSEVGEKWDVVKEWVDNALYWVGNDKSHITEDVRKICESGAAQLWIIYKDNVSTGFVTTQIIENPQGNACYCPWLGGENLGEWVPEGFEHLKKYLKQQNCLSISWMGREAWHKLVKVDSKQYFYSINL